MMTFFFLKLTGFEYWTPALAQVSCKVFVCTLAQVSCKVFVCAFAMQDLRNGSAIFSLHLVRES